MASNVYKKVSNYNSCAKAGTTLSTNVIFNSSLQRDR